MLTQKTSQSFMPALLAVVFLLCPLDAVSDGVRQIEFLQKVGKDKEVYVVTPKRDPSGICVDYVLPKSVQTVPGYENGQTMNIHYLDTSFCSDLSGAAQLFEVKGKDHSERSAKLWWEKAIGQKPHARVDEGADPDGLLWIDNTDSNKIKVWVSYDH
ncbi:hypothetical protein [Endozoicomonas sp. 4G]|uniref:hypothetical protein n=1 Tax=Endozoicomonas sp. 4G TaxID=2872754 RepID=UPI002078FC53|nr:hypothetical protein [Endozoicomonas sp. 4G]